VPLAAALACADPDPAHERPARASRQAAEAGDADAMAHLGHMFANGAGVPASNASALRWFRAAAERGHPSGQYGLGYLHLAGYGLPKDAAAALALFTKVAPIRLLLKRAL